MDHIAENDDFQMRDAKRPKLEPEIFIKDLDTLKTSRADLEERFGKHGKIVDISIGRGSAIIWYEEERGAFDAVRYEHRSLLKDSRIDVSMANKGIHPSTLRADRGSDRGGNRDSPVMRGDRDGMMMRGDRDMQSIRGDRDAPMMRGGNRDTSMMRAERDGSMMRGDRDGTMMRGDRGSDRDGPMMRGDRSSDRDASVMRGSGNRDAPIIRGGGDAPMMRGSNDRDVPMMRGDRSGDRDAPTVRGDRSGDRGSPTRKERNFKEKPRDFHRFGRGNFPPKRDISPAKGFDNFRMMERQNAAPHPPVSTQYSDYFDSQFPYKPNDCEIVVVNKQQREYAESIEVRLKNIGFRVDVLFLKDENLLINTVDDISHRGCLYAMIVSPINETKKSVTLDILHGVPQEHRNMPLDDALKLIARNFHEYLQKQREKADLNHMCYDPNGTFSGSDPEVRVLLKMLSDGQFMTLLELERIISSLEKQKELLITVCNKDSKPSLDSPAIQKEQKPSLHQMELQPNAFTSSQVPFNPATLLGNSNESGSMHPQEDGTINFNSPSVKQALDNLIQSGPGLLKSLVGTPGEFGDESQNVCLSDMDLEVNPEIAQNFSGLGNFAAGGLGHNRNVDNEQPFLSGGPIASNIFGIMPRKF